MTNTVELPPPLSSNKSKEPDPKPKPNLPNLLFTKQSTQTPTNDSAIKIMEVYEDNLYDEFKRIRKIVKKYRFIAMDTEFPGVVAITEQRISRYNQISINVNMLNIIQLGLAFLNEKGELHPDCSVWQFNFKFELDHDMYAADSIKLLQEAGIPFDQLKERGIDRSIFAELFITSGICLNPKVSWITFHSGYDFTYLMKLMRNDGKLPEKEEDFYNLLNLYFPQLYDVKFMLKCCKISDRGLNDIAEQLSVKRIGGAHQAGSDALLTGQTYFKMLGSYFETKEHAKIERELAYGCNFSALSEESKFKGIIYGMSSGSVPSIMNQYNFLSKNDSCNSPTIEANITQGGKVFRVQNSSNRINIKPCPDSVGNGQRKNEADTVEEDEDSREDGKIKNGILSQDQQPYYKNSVDEKVLIEADNRA